MIIFLKKKNKLLFLEIPLLVESALNKHFDKLIFVGANKKLRLKRYLKRKGDKKIFNLLDKRQLSPTLKKNICDYTIDNSYSLAILKKNVKNFIKKYE
jgi:dephospho-CoA kinase